MEQDGGNSVVDNCRRLFFWQGLWPDTAEHNLDFYLKYFPPRLAKLLMKHRLLRLALHIFLRINPLFITITLSIQVFFLFPMGIFVNKSDSDLKGIMQSSFLLIVEGLKLIALLTVYFQPKRLQSILNLAKDMLKLEQLDNEEQKQEFIDTRLFCQRVIGIILRFTGLIILVMSLDAVFKLLPERRFPTREWYPWETQSTPAFEITLLIRITLGISSIFFAFSCKAILYTSISLARSNFKILNNKLTNIRPIAISRIKNRKLNQSARLVSDSEVVVLYEDGRHVTTINQLFQGSEVRLGAHMTRINVPPVFQKQHRDDSKVATFRGSSLHAGQSSDKLKRTLYRQDKLTNLTLLRPLALYEARDIGRKTVSGPLQRSEKSSCNVSRLNNLELLRPLKVKSKPVTMTGNNSLPTSSDALGHLTRNATKRTKSRPSLRETNEDTDKGVNTFLEFTPHELDLELKDVLAENICLHTNFIRYIGMASPFLNAFMLTIFVVNISVIGVTALLITKITGETVNKIVSGFFCAVITVLNLVCNSMCQRISDQHDAITESVYSCDWIEASPSFKKSMLVIMSRGNVPIYIKPTGLYPLSLRNFGHVMNGAYKMINTLNNVLK